MSGEMRQDSWLLQPDVTDEVRLGVLADAAEAEGGVIAIGALNRIVETQPDRMYPLDYRRAIRLGIQQGRLTYTDGGNALMSTTRESLGNDVA